MSAQPRPTPETLEEARTRLGELEQQLAQAEAHHQEHYQQEARLSADLESNLDLMQQDEAWQAEALKLLGSMTRALHRTTLLLAAHELGIIEAGVPDENEALLREARAFLAEKEAYL